MVTRYGCLTLLLLWAGWGLFIELTGGFDDEDGGGRFAMMGLFGVAVYVFGRVLEWLTPRREPRGFPVEPNKTTNQNDS